MCLPATERVAASCDSLAKLALKDTAITKAEVVAAGTFEAPGGRGGEGANPYKALGEFCRVAATLTPTSDSDIKIEVWLPMPRAAGARQHAWNGKSRSAHLLQRVTRIKAWRIPRAGVPAGEPSAGIVDSGHDMHDTADDGADVWRPTRVISRIWIQNGR
jgi:hypothetical protein